MTHYNKNALNCQGLKKEIKYLSVTEQRGTVVDVVTTSFVPSCHVKKISKDLYMKGSFDAEGNFTTTGEVFEARRKEVPMRNRRSLKKIFKDLRQMMTHNFAGGINELFVTLTYAEQTNDAKKVHTDFAAFWKRLKRAYPNKQLSYISIVEPHSSGMFHVHLLLKEQNGEHLYIDNRDMERIWGHGMTETERLESVDNIGAYFVAYFTNQEVPEDKEKEYEALGDIEERNGKKYIKGARLDFYPDGMQIHRHSRDIIAPPKYTGNDALKMFEELKTSADLTFSHVKTVEQTDDKGNTRTAEISTRQYRRKDAVM